VNQDSGIVIAIKPIARDVIAAINHKRALTGNPR
jgi:hypothetical protein